MTFGPLVGVGDLAPLLDTPDLRLADCRFYLDDHERGRQRYLVGHIPGATYVSLDDDLSVSEGPGRHPLPTPAHFAERLRTLGLGDQHRIVAYDDAGGAFAARLWWMLTSLGHDRVAVLDGGIGAWLDAGNPIEAGGPVGAKEPLQPTTVALAATYEGTVEYDDVEAGVGDVLIDARASNRFRGEVEPIDPIAGHIPGAINIPYSSNLTAGRFNSPEELIDHYDGCGVDDATAAVVYCGSGVTACHNILAMQVAGLGRARLYPGSWSDWASHMVEADLH